MNTEPNIKENPSAPSASSAVNQDARSTRGLSRLAGLTAPQLDRINAWLDDAVPYRKIVELCRTEFQADIPHMTIARYNKRSAPRQLLEDLTNSKEAAAEISQYAATGDATFSGTTLEILEQQAFDLASAFHRDHDVEDLATLSQISTLIHKAKNTAVRERHAKVQEQKCALRHEEHDHKLEMDAFRKEIATARLDLANKSFAFRQQQHQDLLALAQTKISAPPNSPGPQSDQQGPFAKNRHDISERVRIRIGISKEEAARRAALRKAYREAQLKPSPAGEAPSTVPETSSDATPLSTADDQSAPAPTSAIGDCPSAIPNVSNQPSFPMTNENCSMLDAQSDSSSSSASSAQSAVNLPPSLSSVPSVLLPPSPEELAKIVDAYTVRRAHEYWAYRRQWSDPYSYRKAPPEYITEFRHCPCGHACPCPIHENEETYGRFPDSFWTRSPHSWYYADCLRDRDLPYREPKEFLA